MATFLKSPISPTSPSTILFQDRISKKHTPHLSGATMLSYFKDSDAYLATPTASSIEISRLHTNSRRSSCASIARPRKRLSNLTVIETLQKIETELTAHRSIMLDIQSRISQLERSSPSTCARLPNELLKSSSQLTSPINRTSNTECGNPQWWDLYPNYEPECNKSLNAKHLLNTPRRLSGFEFDFDALRTKLHIDATTATPEVDDIPPLTPASNGDAHSDTDHEDQAYLFYQLRFPTQNLGLASDDNKSDIVEHIIDLDNAKLPTPPRIQSPPRSVKSKAASIINEDEDITALPEIPLSRTPIIEARPRYSRKLISLITCNSCLNGKVLKKGYKFLTRFHHNAHNPK